MYDHLASYPRLLGRSLYGSRKKVWTSITHAQNAIYNSGCSPYGPRDTGFLSSRNFAGQDCVSVQKEFWRSVLGRMCHLHLASTGMGSRPATRCILGCAETCYQSKYVACLKDALRTPKCSHIEEPKPRYDSFYLITVLALLRLSIFTSVLPRLVSMVNIYRDRSSAAPTQRPLDADEFLVSRRYKVLQAICD